MMIKKFNTKILNEKGYWVDDLELEDKINNFLADKELVFYNITSNVDFVLIIYDLIGADEPYEVHNKELKLKK